MVPGKVQPPFAPIQKALIQLEHQKAVRKFPFRIADVVIPGAFEPMLAIVLGMLEHPFPMPGEQRYLEGMRCNEKEIKHDANNEYS